nr:putative copia-type Pol polyprotein [Tanacetum cinerariifolium]
MSRDVLTVGSTMRIPLLYRVEYSQWVERFMNYLEEQTDGEAMINCVKNDKSMWSNQEKKIQKIDRLARSLLIQGLPNDIYSLIDSNKLAKDLWDALARHMLGFEYVINDLKKCGYAKDNCELNFKFLNNLQPEWKQYATMMRQNKNLVDINIDALYNILKQNQGDVNDAMGLKKKTIVLTSDLLALIAEKTKQTSSLKSYVMNIILEKIIIDLEDEVLSLLEKEKANLETIESLKSKGFESRDNVIYESENQSENDCQVVEKQCDKWRIQNKLERKRRKRKSSKQHDKQANKDVLRANKVFVHFSNLNTLSSVRRPKPSGVMWMRKGSSNTVKADLSSVNHSNLNKNVKRYSRKNLMACNNFDACSAFDCNNARNALCNARMNASVDVNDLFVFDDVSIRKSHVRNKPRGSLNVRSKIKASSLKSWLWHQRLSHLNFATINNLVKNNLVQGVPKIKFEKNHLCFACEQGKIHRKHHKSKMAFASNKPLYLLHMDLCGPMRIESINEKRYVLVFVDDYSRMLESSRQKELLECLLDIQKSLLLSENKRTRKIHESMNVNFDEISEMASKQFSLEPGLSNLNETRKSSNLAVSQVSETSKKDLEDLFHNFYDEYFDASKIMKSSTMNVKISNVKIPSHEEETKDHPLHKIIGDPKSSVRTRGQLANSCLFSCLLSSIKPANVAEALRDADWVSAMQDELDQFTRLKVWRLVPRPKGKTIIKTKWIFKIRKMKAVWLFETKQGL